MKNQELELYKSLPSYSVPPRADAMIENFRAMGYTIQTAIADLLDNCIDAQAKNIWVNFNWELNNSTISILDDGCGMTNEELVEAMRPSTKNPNELRDTKDLGRFGLGLKTASFSQCRQLIVASKKKQALSHWAWDLDYIKETKSWDLIELKPQDYFISQLNKLEKGTLVIWNKLDRVISKKTITDEEKSKANYYAVAEIVKKHLAMVFHRYIESKKIKIFFNNREVESWDPFLKGNSYSQIMEDNLQYGTVKIKGYILPHKSKLTEEEYKKAEGINGWNAQQGFYIYRNERLLVAGDWLGMFRKEDHYKLARIMVDLPNTTDGMWQLDIKKSVAIPPQEIKEQLRAIAGRVRTQAVEVFRHKGKTILRKYPNNQFQPIWQEKTRHGKRFYEINRENEIIKNLLDSSKEAKTTINQLLRFVEESIPIDLITIKQSEAPELQGNAFEDTNHDSMREMMKMIFQSLIKNGKTSEQAKGYLLSIEPFHLYPQYVDALS
jgi:hypothetical protein